MKLINYTTEVTEKIIYNPDIKISGKNFIVTKCPELFYIVSENLKYKILKINNDKIGSVTIKLVSSYEETLPAILNLVQKHIELEEYSNEISLREISELEEAIEIVKSKEMIKTTSSIYETKDGTLNVYSYQKDKNYFYDVETYERYMEDHLEEYQISQEKIASLRKILNGDDEAGRLQYFKNYFDKKIKLSFDEINQLEIEFTE